MKSMAVLWLPFVGNYRTLLKCSAAVFLVLRSCIGVRRLPFDVCANHHSSNVSWR